MAISRKGEGRTHETMEQMTAKELLNLIDWLREQGFDDDKVVECMEAVRGKKDQQKENDSNIPKGGREDGKGIFGS